MRDYTRHRAAMARDSREASAAGRDIRSIPPIADPARRAEAARDLLRWCATYLPSIFTMPFCRDHRIAAEKIERAVRHGELFALAMPRGSGKSSLCEAAILWATLNGMASYAVCLGPNERHAERMLANLRMELETNEMLGKDYPEVCAPIAALERITQRASGQTYRGVPTYVAITACRIVLPTIPGSAASGAILECVGLTGGIRGMKYRRPDGQVVRPGLVLLDDPQTDESARSPSQCDLRERLISGTVLGLAGPGRRIAGLAAVTVIAADDLADRLLDRTRHPHWQGERTQLLYGWPEAGDLWAKYADLLRRELAAGRGPDKANRFYARHRKRMDAGATAAWPERHRPDEISAIQHAMHLWIRDPCAFWAEYQNDPQRAVPDADQQHLDPAAVAERLHGHEWGVPPETAAKLCAYVDVQQRLLWYLVAAFDADGTGYVVAYGSEPEQPEHYYHLTTARHTLQAAFPGEPLEAAIYGGLTRLVARLCGRTWTTAAGMPLRIDRLGIDANWSQQTVTVYRFCSQSPFAAVLIPGHGRGIGASSPPMDSWRTRPGEMAGTNWRIGPAGPGRTCRHLVYDTNWWKSYAAAALRAGVGTPGSITLPGRDPRRHRMLADHCAAERPIRVEGRGRTVDEWRLRGATMDNHLWDCLIGTVVLAHVCGCGTPRTRTDAPRVVSFAAAQAAARNRRTAQ